MKSFEKFAGNQLSKQEMNKVKGGEYCMDCTMTMAGHTWAGEACGTDAGEILSWLHKTYGEFEITYRISCTEK